MYEIERRLQLGGTAAFGDEYSALLDGPSAPRLPKKFDITNLDFVVEELKACLELRETIKSDVIE